MQDELSEHKKIINAIKEIISADSRCLGLILGGSFGREDVDQFSDIDFWVVLNDNQALESFLADLSSLVNKVGTPIFSVTQNDLPGFGVSMYRVIFENMVLCDLHLNTSDTLRSCPPRNHNLILVEKAGFFYIQRTHDQIEQDTYTPSIEKELEDILGWFVFDCSLVFRRVMKGELWNAIFYLDRCRALLFHLLRLYSGISGIFQERPSRQIEKDIPLHLQDGLEKTLPGYNIESIIDTLEFLVSHFVKISHELAEREGLESFLSREKMIVQILKYWCNYLKSYNSIGTD